VIGDPLGPLALGRDRGRFFHRALAPAVMVAAALGPPGTAAEAADTAAETPRPRVGLVLGGGGARGAAHIGVLEVLERARVPVDCVAGTSMGALVAGAWAAGLSPQSMRRELAGADWADMFLDDPDYAERSMRSKWLAQHFLPGSETGIAAQGAVAPPGFVYGQKIKLFLNRLVHADHGERPIEQLPMPLSIVATDIANGERVVLRSGSLTRAMRASMAVPGLLAPLELDGRRLVDGGLVDNLPLREVRERCGAEVVIAVNVGSPPLPADRIGGLLGITAQMVALLTEQNVSASLATIRAADVLVKPDLEGITAADFQRHAEAADRGREAAEALLPRLQALSVPAEAYAAWRVRAGIAAQDKTAPAARVDEIEIAGLARGDTRVVQRWIRQQPGRALDTRTLQRDLLRAYGDGHYEQLDYALVRRGERNVLRILPVEKSWGPDYLRLALQLDSNLAQGSTYQLRAGYHKTWLNRLGGELLFVGEIGGSTGASAEWYQPLEGTQGLFADAGVMYRRERIDYFFGERRISRYLAGRSQFEAALGANIGRLGQVRAGWRTSRVQSRLETGRELGSADAPGLLDVRAEGWLLALDLDQRDRRFFPRQGWSLTAQLFANERDGAQGEWQRLGVEARGVWSLRDTVLATRLAWTGSPRGELPLAEAARLGGLLNLSGFASGQLVGDEVGYAQLRAERILGRAPLGLRGDLRLGVALEAGRVGQPYTRPLRDGWLHSLAVYLGGESPFGPAYLGLGWGNGGSFNAYLVIGNP
jgi:NTE family protein